LGKQYKTLIYKTGPLYIKQYKEFKENINWFHSFLEIGNYVKDSERLLEFIDSVSENIHDGIVP
jgi:hypothetical protein